MEDVNLLLKDLSNYDPHIRQNAVRSLSHYYLDDNKRNSLKEDVKSQIVTGLLSRLENKEDSLEVKGCAVKNFGLISRFLKENEIIQIFSKIIMFIIDQKAVGKDIYVTCIKAILKEMNGSSCYTVGKVIIPQIIKGLQENSSEIKELCYDTFNDYINTFNFVLIKESESVIKNKEKIFSTAINTIQIDNQSLRYRISSFLGNFSVILNKPLLGNLLEGLVEKIKYSNDIKQKIAYLTALNSVARNSGNRHAEYTKYHQSILTIIYEICSNEYLTNNSNDYDLNNDLVECGLGLIETYILKLSNCNIFETDKIVKIILELIEYDPNFVYSDEPYDCYEYYENDGYEECVYGDDSSWKVRRAAVRVIQSFIKSRIDIKRNAIEIIIQSLVFNIREHEENTKLDIITTLSNLLRYFVIEDESGIAYIGYSNSSANTGLVKQKSVTNFIPSVVNKLIESIVNELKGKNQKIKSAILQLLSSLALVDPVDIILHFHMIQPYLDTCLKENNSALTLFVFLSRLLKSLKTCENIPIDQLLSWIFLGLKNDFYKINIECLNVAFHMIRLLVENLPIEEYKSKLNLLLDELLPKFKANDVDQELKLTLISTVGNVILYMGHHLPNNSIQNIFAIYLDKIKNENLRPLVFNWLTIILKGNSNLNLESALAQFIPFTIDILGKNTPLHIQYQTLEFLSVIIKLCPNSIANNETKLIETLVNMKSEDSLLPLIYDILNSAIFYFKLNIELLEKILIDTVNKVSSMGGNSSVTINLQTIFTYISNVTKFLDQTTLSKYVESILDFSSMNYNKAHCIAILANSSGVDEKLISVSNSILCSKKSDEEKKNSLMCLGELSLLSKDSSNVLINLQNLITVSNSEMKNNLAVCIGKVGVTDQISFVNHIVKNTSKEAITYNFISIREFLHVISSDNSKYSLDLNNSLTLFKILVLNANDQDEKLRLLCGECIGLLANLNEAILKDYLNYFKHDNPATRATFFYGMKFIFNKSSNYLENYLDMLFNALLSGMTDIDITVKQNAFSSLINFVHNYPYFIKTKNLGYSDLSSIFIKEHIIDEKLITTVDIGAGMNIKNDKGLPIRKAILSTTQLLLDFVPEKINIRETLQMCLYGLDDNDDIQALCHSCLLKISHLAPEAFISVLDLLCDNFKKKIDNLNKLSSNTTATVDSKKLSDLVMNINRLFKEIKKVHEIEENPKFVDLTNEIMKFNK